ncbi:hypothetical protein LCGC14_1191590 [marine sediment metagenome]|uniref:Uncharacterized protein n=2 Tax=root TaxID=1 RepID=A0A831QJ70_9FLAO|nr:hypothetical protein [Pricia sp.]HEA19629.1 hypothetical protein [Pricia antarctica]
MTKQEIAKAKDSILKFMLDNTKINRAVFANDSYYDQRDFWSKLFDRKISSETIDRFISQIINYPDTIVSNFKESGIQPNELTKTFLDEGGFVGLYEKERKKIIDLENAKTVIALKNTRQAKLAKWQIITFWPLFVLGIFGGVYSAIDMLESNENISVDKYNSNISEIKKKIDSLRINFKQENNQLEERLYEAEMLIAVYESDSLP